MELESINKKLEDEIQASKTPIMKCYSCKMALPLISISLKTTEDIYISIKCLSCSFNNTIKVHTYIDFIKTQAPIDNYCTKKAKHEDNKALLFCINCQEWICHQCFIDHRFLSLNHVYSNTPIKGLGKALETSCALDYNLPYVSYCNQCKVKTCKECNNTTHWNHTITLFDKLDSIYNELNDQMTNEQNEYHALIAKINDQINQLIELRDSLKNTLIKKKKNEDMIIQLTKIALDNFKKYQIPQELELIIDINKIFKIKKEDSLMLYQQNAHVQLVNSFTNEKKLVTKTNSHAWNLFYYIICDIGIYYFEIKVPNYDYFFLVISFGSVINSLHIFYELWQLICLFMSFMIYLIKYTYYRLL